MEKNFLIKNEMKKIALLCVSDKEGIVDFAKQLLDLDYGVVATSSTYKVLVSSGLDIQDIESLTGFPEILDGRVRTLHPKVHGGILFDRANLGHINTVANSGIVPVDLVCVNLYAFEQISEETTDELILRDHIDIGGHSLLRASAKNSQHVWVVSNIGMYQEVIAAIKSKVAGLLPPEDESHLRKRLMIEALQCCKEYDEKILQIFKNL